MKYKYLIISLLLVFYFSIVYSQKSPKIENPSDSIKLKVSPYFFYDENRPYKINPKKWLDFPQLFNSLDEAQFAIDKAKDDYDAYRVLQLSMLEQFKDEKSRKEAFYFVFQYGYLQHDPFILFYLMQYMQDNPVANSEELSPKFLANAVYKIAALRNEAALLRKIAKVNTDFGYLTGISYDEITQKANQIDGSIAPNYTQCKNTLMIRHEGMLISGSISNGKGIKEYTVSDEVVRKGWRYEGEFVDGFENFQGNLYDEECNAVYIGQWDKGLFAGAGKFNNVDGTYYIGLFLNGKCHGQGKLYDRNGNLIYSGEFNEGKITGKGKRFYHNGDIYEGDFIDAKRNGKGIYTFNNRIRYEGDFVENLRHGKGKLYDARNLLYYDGQFVNDEPNGQAISYDLTDGSWYEGNHTNGLKNGRMIHFLKDGRQRYETWENGKMIVDSHEEQAFIKKTIDNQNKKEFCPSKILGEGYTMELPGSPERKELNEFTTVHFYTTDKFVYSFTEFRNENYKNLSVEDTRSVLNKVVNCNGYLIVKDAIFTSNKAGLWCRHLILDKDGKGEGQYVFLDSKLGKIYIIRVSALVKATADKELDLLNTKFIYGGNK